MGRTVVNNLELFKAALGLQDPWTVASMDFDAAGHRLDLHLDFARGSRFPCPEGDEGSCAVHDTSEKTWRHLDFFQHQAYLHARVPRVACPAHGVRQVAVPWARPESGFTLLFEALLMALVTDMPVRAAADLTGEHDTRLWRVLHHYVGLARAARSDAGVRQVGIDETSARRGHDYISLFVDLERSAVLYATEGRDHTTVERFAQDLAAHGGDPEAVTDACCDMSPAYMLGIETSLPNGECLRSSNRVGLEQRNMSDVGGWVQAAASPPFSSIRSFSRYDGPLMEMTSAWCRSRSRMAVASTSSPNT